MSFAISDEKAFEFLKALQLQFEHYSKLVLLGIEQAECVKNTKEDALLKVIKEKQKLINKVDALSKKFIVEKKLLEETPMGQFSCIDQEFDEVLKAVEKVLKKLIENETRDMDVLKSFQIEHHGKMEHLNRGKNVAQAYLNRGPKSRMDRQV